MTGVARRLYRQLIWQLVSREIVSSLPVILSTKLLRLAFSFVTRQAIALLKLAAQNFCVAFQLINLVISELSPSLLDLALELREITLDGVFVHNNLRLTRSAANALPQRSNELQPPKFTE